MGITKELDVVYICSDGTRFITREEAEEHENKDNSIVNHYNMMGDIENLVG